MPAKPFKFVILTDIQLGDDNPNEGKFNKLPSRALSLVRYLVTRINNEIRPDFVIQLGNLIENDDAEIDEENLTKLADAFKQLSMPIYHVLGNQDLANLNFKQVGTILKCPKQYYSFDAGNFHFVVLFSEATDSAVHISEAQQKWLADDLNSSTKPIVVFSHHPIDEQELSDNFCFEQSPSTCFVEERSEIRPILARSGKVRAVLSGHLHRNNLLSHDGIHYLTIQSLVKNMAKVGKTASESFAVVTLTDNEICVEVEGVDPAEYRLSGVL